MPRPTPAWVSSDPSTRAIPEIADLRPAALVHEHAFSQLDVPVHDPLAVSLFRGPTRPAPRCGPPGPPDGVLLQDGLQRDPGTYSITKNTVSPSTPRSYTDTMFGCESRARPPAPPGGIVQVFPAKLAGEEDGTDRLHGDSAIELGVARPVNRAHPALPQQGSRPHARPMRAGSVMVVLQASVMGRRASWRRSGIGTILDVALADAIGAHERAVPASQVAQHDPQVVALDGSVGP